MSGVDTEQHIKLDRMECWKIVNEECDQTVKMAVERISNHTFTVELKEGKLPVECIRGWLLNSYAWALEINMSAPKKYYRFNDLLNENVDLLAMLADKYADEFATPGRGGHQRTMDTLGEALGLDTKEMLAYRQLPAMRGMLDATVWANEVGRLGMSIAEEWLGHWFALWFESLTKHYGLTEDEALYFAMHAEADSLAEHQSGESIGHEVMGHGQSHRYLAVRLLEDGLLTTQEVKEMIFRSAGIDSYLNFLDAIYFSYHPTKQLSELEQSRR